MGYARTSIYYLTINGSGGDRDCKTCDKFKGPSIQDRTQAWKTLKDVRGPQHEAMVSEC